MILEGVIHCEAEGCESHQRLGPDTVAAGRLAPGWVVVRLFENNGAVLEHGFCEANCALKWLSTIPPSEVHEGPPPGWFGEKSDGPEADQ